MNTAELWWRRITNAVRYRQAVTEALEDGKSVILQIPAQLPWRDMFMELLRTKLREISAVKSFDLRTPPKDIVPGEYLLNVYCKEAERAAYWPTVPHSQYLAQSRTTVLKRKFVYLTNIPAGKTKDWADFLQAYMTACPTEEHGQFLVETTESIPLQSSDAVAVLRYDDYVSDYDCLMLALAVTSSLQCGSENRKYIAEIACNIAGGDVELTGYLAEQGEVLATHPIMKAKDALDLPIITNELKQQVHSAVWEAQLKIVFPKIEQFRNRFIQKYFNMLKGKLPIKNTNHQPIYDPNELEIGQLYHLTLSSRQVEKAEFEQLKLYYKARNLLAHIEVLTYHQLQEIWES